MLDEGTDTLASGLAGVNYWPHCSEFSVGQVFPVSTMASQLHPAKDLQDAQHTHTVHRTRATGLCSFSVHSYWYIFSSAFQHVAENTHAHTHTFWCCSSCTPGDQTAAICSHSHDNFAEDDNNVLSQAEIRPIQETALCVFNIRQMVSHLLLRHNEILSPLLTSPAPDEWTNTERKGREDRGGMIGSTACCFNKRKKRLLLLLFQYCHSPLQSLSIECGLSLFLALVKYAHNLGNTEDLFFVKS